MVDFRTSPRWRAVWAALIALAMLFAVWCASGSAATSASVVGANVLSATDLTPGYCPPGGAGTTIGPVPANVGIVAGGDCSITFGSSNDSSQLRMFQPDRLGRAMYQPVTGALDTGFSGDGMQDHNGYWVYDGARYPGGGFVTVGETWGGSTYEFQVRRYADDGSVTWTAMYQQPACGDCMPFDVAVLADGDIITAGHYTGATTDLAFMRFTPAGALRATFGGGYPRHVRAGLQRAFAVLEQPGYGILAAGRDDGNAFLARYRDDGTIDPTFAGGGFLSIDLGGANDTAYDLALDSQGRILVAGQNGANGSADLFVQRYSAAGVLDTNFGAGGTALTDANGTWASHEDRVSLAVDSRTGDIFVAGRSHLVAANTVVAKLTSAGLPAPGFGTSGVADIDVTAGQGDEAEDLLIEAGGTLLVAVQSGLDPDRGRLLRLTATGARDATFGTNGVADVGSLLSDPQYGLWFADEFDGRVAMGGGERTIRLSTTTFPDYAGGTADWSTGSAFGVCLRELVGTTPDGTTWPVDGNLDCTTSVADPWRAVPIGGAAAKVARIAAPGSATAHLRFGLRNDGTIRSGAYVAPITFEVVAPNS